MGANCSVGQGVTIGFKGGKSTCTPRIGNNVHIGTSAVVVGDITIGDGAMIECQHHGGERRATGLYRGQRGATDVSPKGEV